MPTASARPSLVRRSSESVRKPVSGEGPVSRNGSRAAAQFPGDFLTRHTLEHSEFNHLPERWIDRRQTVQRVVDFKERLFIAGLWGRKIGQGNFFSTLGEWASVMNQQPLHEVGG